MGNAAGDLPSAGLPSDTTLPGRSGSGNGLGNGMSGRGRNTRAGRTEQPGRGAGGRTGPGEHQRPDQVMRPVGQVTPENRPGQCARGLRRVDRARGDPRPPGSTRLTEQGLRCPYD